MFFQSLRMIAFNSGFKMMIRFRRAFRFGTVLLLAYLAPWQVGSSDAAQNVMAGQTLMTFCNGKYDTDQGVCSGYVMAIAEAMTQGQDVYGQRSCGHDGIKAQQLVDLVKMEIGENPDLQKQPAGAMIATVMSRSFPCYGNFEPAAGQ